MKIYNQLCTFDQAKELKALGVVQSAHFFFTTLEGGHPVLRHRDSDESPLFFVEEHYSAFSVAELGEMLAFFESMAMYVYPEWHTEAQRRAGIIIRLLKSGHLPVDWINAEMQRHTIRLKTYDK